MFKLFLFKPIFTKSSTKYKILRHFVFIAMVLTSLPSCSSSKQSVNNSMISIKTNYPVSARTKQFVAELNNELPIKNDSLENYTPSNKLIEKYNIRKQEGLYYVSGFIKFSENFDKSNLEKINVFVGKTSNLISTVQVPLNKLNQFFQITGITYFEIAEKAELK